MKNLGSIQTKLKIPTELETTLATPLYICNEKKKFGNLSQLALTKGKWKLSCIEKDNGIYEFSSTDVGTFSGKLVRKNGSYKIISPSIIDENVPHCDRINVNGISPSGKSLRPAQVGAIYALLAHWSLSKDVATIVLPTGTGKTETMLAVTIADNAQRTLIIVPSIELKYQIAGKYHTWGILRQLGVLNSKVTNPKVLVLEKTLADQGFKSTLEKADVVITTPALIARASEQIQNYLKSAFSHVFFDEAHHVQANEWTKIKSLLKAAKIVQFTATPYRNDKKPIEGKIVYNYPLSQALKDRCFSKISLISVDENHPMKKDRAIAEAAMDRLTKDRQAGFTRHKMMVRADKVSHAEELVAKYKEWFPSERITIVHSETARKKKLIEAIKRGEYDIIVCVDMLKEGFDFPDFKVAAVHRLHQSLGVLLQFIGRFTRTQEGLGDASFVVNFSDENISTELENLLQDGQGWENVISEIADEQKAKAESLLNFLQGCKPFSGFDSPDLELNPKIVYPTLSCISFKCDGVDWSKFKDAFNLKKYAITQPYFNSVENVFYFTTQKRERVKWAKTNRLSDQTWSLIVMHWDKLTRLLYVHVSDKTIDFDLLVKKISIGESVILNGDCVFRSFDSIKRLSIVHAGIFKPANHLHRYSRLSGADVTTELARWKQGNNIKKSDFVGIGFRDGTPESVGASVKGKIWSPARIGDLTQWKAWCLKMGKLITDSNIDANQILKDSAKKTQLDEYPSNLIVLASDWNEDLYSKIHKLTINESSIGSFMLAECNIRNTRVNGKSADFLLTVQDREVSFSVTLGGENGHNIDGLNESKLEIEGLKSEPISIKRFFEENPPTIFLLDGCTISGSIYTQYNLEEIGVFKIPSDRIEMLKWENVIFHIESMYKKGNPRNNSIQEYMMKRLVQRGAKIVFNDDNSGESADIIAIFQDDSVIRFELIHCKYSKSKSGARINDLYEVCGQAIVSLRYKWKPEELLKHMDRRNGTGVLSGKRYYHGSADDTELIKKAIKYTNVSFEFAIAQPGVESKQLSADMESFLGSIYSTVVEMTETKLRCYFS